MLVLRVLYRLRSLSEQAPFDVATFSYAFPLLARVLYQGGIAVSEDEEALEQVALVLGILKFHCSKCMIDMYYSTFTRLRRIASQSQTPTFLAKLRWSMLSVLLGFSHG